MIITPKLEAFANTDITTLARHICSVLEVARARLVHISSSIDTSSSPGKQGANLSPGSTQTVARLPPSLAKEFLLINWKFLRARKLIQISPIFFGSDPGSASAVWTGWVNYSRIGISNQNFWSIDFRCERNTRKTISLGSCLRCNLGLSNVSHIRFSEASKCANMWQLYVVGPHVDWNHFW